MPAAATMSHTPAAYASQKSCYIDVDDDDYYYIISRVLLYFTPRTGFFILYAITMHMNNQQHEQHINEKK